MTGRVDASFELANFRWVKHPCRQTQNAWEDISLVETQRETDCPAHSQLTFHIKMGSFDGGAVAGNVVDNDSRVGFIVHYDAYGGC